MLLCYGCAQAYVSRKHQGDKVLVFERPYNLLWLFNFHPTQSFTDYKIGVGCAGKYPSRHALVVRLIGRSDHFDMFLHGL